MLLMTQDAEDYKFTSTLSKEKLYIAMNPSARAVMCVPCSVIVVHVKTLCTTVTLFIDLAICVELFCRPMNLSCPSSLCAAVV